MSCADIARVAFATLRHRIEPTSTGHAVSPVETKLIVRQTTGRPAGELGNGMLKAVRVKAPQRL
jgi:hypothetical protein